MIKDENEEKLQKLRAEIAELENPQECAYFLREHFDLDSKLKDCRAKENDKGYCAKRNFKGENSILVSQALENKMIYHLQCLLVKVKNSRQDLNKANLVAAIEDEELSAYFN